jgi:hypothetical protein
MGMRSDNNKNEWANHDEEKEETRKKRSGKNVQCHLKH